MGINRSEPLRSALNRVAGTSGLDARGAANRWAGTTGLSTVGALNKIAGTQGLALRGVLNVLAGPGFAARAEGDSAYAVSPEIDGTAAAGVGIRECAYLLKQNRVAHDHYSDDYSDEYY